MRLSVYIIQPPEASLEQARKFGPLKVALGKSAEFNHSYKENIETLRKVFSTFETDDYLMLSGNPIFIGVATSYAADATSDGFIKFLKWDRQAHEYLVFELALYDQKAEEMVLEKKE